MSVDLNLLRALADGDVHSGSELGDLAGISRAAIWKQLQKLQEQTGLLFEPVKGKGYRLSGGMELLDKDLITRSIPLTALPFLSTIELHTQIDSTNKQAMLRAQAGAASGYTVLAEHQLAGKGRRGRSWVSPFGSNLYLSVVWAFENGAAALEGLSLAVGVAVARALTAVGVLDIGLKWPNDIYWQGKKLGGILLEMVGDAAGFCQVIIGVGINVRMPHLNAVAIDQPWSDLNTAAGRVISRNQLAADVLAHLLLVLDQFQREGFFAFREEWARFDCIAGKRVALHSGESTRFGTAAGVGATGALVLDTELGREWFHGGEVSLRLQ
jgi:BirA family biotin operon repressor/biotin-[acetyl-CoA-carboxylase] ligase